MATELPNGTSAVTKPIQISFPLPNSSSVRIHLHLTIQSTSLLLFLTTVAADSAPSTCPLGSFVYAIPSRDASTQPLCTSLYNHTQTLDLATRMAKILARRTGKPTYVGNSMSFMYAARGGDVEEEMAGFRRIVELVMEEVVKSNDEPCVHCASHVSNVA